MSVNNIVAPGTLLQERFLVEEEIGRGGMGAVYVAVDQKFGNRVAVKETFYEDAELSEAFEREARLLNGAHHPILPHVSDYFSEDGRHFLVMEYIEGEDLSEMLKREGSFPVSDVSRWTREILDGLDYLHSQDPPIIHRDIKPNNLKLTSRGNIILLDFGLAKETSGENLEMQSVFGYSRRYSPLEQIQGTGTDARSDIFSLGATAFHLLTGAPAIDVLARASAVIAGKPDPLHLASELNENVPIALAELLRSSLALDPGQRFISAKAMQAALEIAVDSDSIVSDDEAKVSGANGEAARIVVPNDSFPALQAFAADTEQNTLDAEHYDTVPVRPTTAEDSVKPVVSQKSKEYRDDPAKNFWLRSGVLTLIIVGFLTALSYGVYRSNSVGEAADAPADSAVTEQNAGEESASAPAAAPVEELIVPIAKKPSARSSNPARTEAVNRSSDNPTVTEKAETPVRMKEVEIPSRPKPAEPRRQNSQASRQPRRQTSRSDDSGRPIARIEDIFTGTPSGREQRQAERQRRREQRWEEEDDDFRRRRRERRRENRRPNEPF